MLLLLVFALGTPFQREPKIDLAIQRWVRSLVHAVSGRQTVVQQNSIEALHQNRNPLKQIPGLSSLASIDWDPSFKISQGFNSNWLKDVTGPRSIYLSSLRVAVNSAAAPTSWDALSTYDSANGQVTVTSQHNDLRSAMEPVRRHLVVFHLNGIIRLAL